jgi:hypothetical protein
MKFERWTKEQIKIAVEMRESRKNFREIGEVLGKSPKAVSVKLTKMKMSGAQIEHQYTYQRERLRAQHTTPNSGGANPSQAALDDRALRLGIAPRDLTAAAQGDPLPGYSALDRRS